MRAIALAILLFTIAMNINARKARQEKIDDVLLSGVAITFAALVVCLILGV